MEIAVVGAAALVTLDGDGDVAACRVALTAVAPTIMRAPGAEHAIAGEPASEETLAAVAAGAAPTPRRSATCAPATRYRRHTVGVIARRAVEAAVAPRARRARPVPANRAFGVGAPLGG